MKHSPLSISFRKITRDKPLETWQLQTSPRVNIVSNIAILDDVAIKSNFSFNFTLFFALNDFLNNKKLIKIFVSLKHIYSLSLFL